jgi:hypothetical protein
VTEHAATASTTTATPTHAVPITEGMTAAFAEGTTAGMVFVTMALKLVARIIIPEWVMGVLMPAVAHGTEKHVIFVHTLLLRYIVVSGFTIYLKNIF